VHDPSVPVPPGAAVGRNGHPTDTTEPPVPYARDRLDALLPGLYAELRRIAAAHLRNERSGHTLNTTALVHEAYIRLVGIGSIDWTDRSRFLGMASRTMRRVLIDYARSRARQKRDDQRISIGAPAGLSVGSAVDLLALDDALDRLESLEPRQSRVVECRFFAGMTHEETAESLSISVATVKRDWTIARAWLHSELSDDGTRSGR
jgi:RNA polymerase sigma-70 factor, ECF subfamily